MATSDPNSAGDPIGKGDKIPRLTSEEQQHDLTHPRGTFHQDRLEPLCDHGQHPLRDPDEDEQDEDQEEEDRADEPPVVREPDETNECARQAGALQPVEDRSE